MFIYLQQKVRMSIRALKQKYAKAWDHLAFINDKAFMLEKTKNQTHRPTFEKQFYERKVQQLREQLKAQIYESNLQFDKLFESTKHKVN